MANMSLQEARMLLAPQIDSAEIALEEINKETVIHIINILLFHNLMLAYKTVETIAPNFLAISGGCAHLILPSGEKAFFVVRGNYPIIDQVRGRTDKAWNMLSFPKIETVDSIFHNNNLANYVDKNNNTHMSMLQTVVDLVSKVYAALRVAKILNSLNVPIRVLDRVFPPAILNKLNPDWQQIPAMNRSDKFSNDDVAMLKSVFQAIDSEIISDDGLAMLVY